MYRLFDTHEDVEMKRQGWAVLAAMTLWFARLGRREFSIKGRTLASQRYCSKQAASKVRK